MIKAWKRLFPAISLFATFLLFAGVCTMDGLYSLLAHTDPGTSIVDIGCTVDTNPANSVDRTPQDNVQSNNADPSDFVTEKAAEQNPTETTRTVSVR